MQADRVRIVKNAGWLFVRLGVATLADLLVVRLIVGGFGVARFGAYAAILSVVSFVFFLRWAVELAIRRFLSVACGRGGSADVARIFSAGCVFSALVCAVLLLGAETVGLYFADTRLVLDADGRSLLAPVFQLGVAALAVETLRMPFEALIIASERMAFFAKASVASALMGLLSAGAALLVKGGRVEVFMACCLGQAMVLLGLYWGFCRRHLPDFARFVMFRREDLAGIVRFFLKSLPSDLANVLKNDGVGLVLNALAGVRYNATYRMSSRVGTSVYGIVGSFQQAYFPALVKAWSVGDRDTLRSLLAFTLRVSAAMSAVFVLPLLLATGPILSFWIGSGLPPEAVAFVRCVAVHYFFSALTAPLHTLVLATGRIGVYQLIVAGFMVAGFALAWGALVCGLPAWSSVAAVALTNAFSFVYRVFCVRRLV